jgi:enhancer of polycomb-like protein
LLFSLGEEDETALDEEVEGQGRLEEQWKFDIDDTPPIRPDGAEEHDLQLIDDYDTV